MKNTRFFGITTAFCFALFFLGLSFSSGQDVPATPAENTSKPKPAEPLKIKVSVDEVRLDVVVLDKKGDPITDLTAADFEVFQDGKRQEVKSSVYVDYLSGAADQSANSPNASSFQLPPSMVLKKEDLRRTIIFLIDDAAMSFENGYYTKMALRNFVEKQMQQGDLVAILRTDYGNRVLNMFLSDKREVLARINAIPATMSLAAELRHELKRQRAGSGSPDKFLFQQYQELLKALHENRIATISYSLSLLKNIPGRKIMVMTTPFSTHTTFSLNTQINEDEVASLYTDSYARLADYALREGVVINFLDIEGLELYQNQPVDASIWRRPEAAFRTDSMEQGLYAMLGGDPIVLYNPLPAMTGGITIENSNFFLDGIGKETESLLRGYYLITYVPPLDTFKTRDKKDNNYRRLKVNVNRKDAVVHTRAGFFGRLEKEPEADAPKNPLIEAIYSPFKEDDINVNITAGYIKGIGTDYLVRSWIHLDSKEINIKETGDGVGSAALEAIFVTFDINGNILDSNRVEFTLTNINTEWVKKHGIRFSMVLPVKKPGPYYVRIAVQDAETKKTGAAYQFLDIPDLKKKGLAMSNIFMLTSADDIQWMNSDVKKEVGQGVFFPMLQAEEVRSPALRTYKSGDNLMTLAMLYNADAKAISRSEIETQTILYKDGKEFLRGATVPITPGQIEDPGSIPLLNRLSVGTNMPPGDYVLQIVVTDKKNSKKNEGNASQFISFTVTE